ncbi:MAG: hypothetical protein LUE24_13795 [Lachnospiraceae bacterium]|nr:hypothetical protein [Lachnospiraceae bacterium]
MIHVFKTPEEELNGRTLEELLDRFENGNMTVFIHNGRILWEQKEES